MEAANPVVGQVPARTKKVRVGEHPRAHFVSSFTEKKENMHMCNQLPLHSTSWDIRLDLFQRSTPRLTTAGARTHTPLHTHGSPLHMHVCVSG